MQLELDALVARHPAARPGALPALRGVGLRLRPGEAAAVIGPSGAGKTTLLHAAAMALRPSAGRIGLAQCDPWQLRATQRHALRGRLFLAPQTPPLPPRQRVVTSVLAGRLPAMGFWASVRSLFYPIDIPAAFAALEQFDLGDKLFERVDRLSGGERQRVGLARALLTPASLWLIDEPLSALDPVRAQQAIATLIDIARERGVTLLATLHQVEVALARFPRLIGLRDGEVRFDLPAGEVTREQLAQLYAQHEDELQAPAREQPADEKAPAPAVLMQCR
jgi:phosphonate transport system ATP-binding protein